MRRSYIGRLLRIDPHSKPALYAQIYGSAELSSANYLLDLVFAAAIATLGLVLNSPAVVIGAMLISPLMGPILAVGLAFAASDIYLGIRSIVTLTGSVITSVAFSALLVWLLPFQAPTSEILARTQPNLLDLAVAVFSGLAGSLVTARSLSSGAASALPGVAIAVALMPPLCTVGIGFGSGVNWQIIYGSALLFLTNLVAIAGSAFFVFYLVGMDEPEARASVSEETMRRAAGTGIYALLHDSALGRLLGDVGQLRWRIVMVIVTFGALFIPLRSSLLQLRDETVCRAAAREAVRALLPPDHVLSQQVEILPDRLIQRLVTTSAPDKQSVVNAEAYLGRRTGKIATIQLRQVANEEEIASLREHLRAPDPAPPPATLTSLRTEAWRILDEPLRSLWPAEAAELAAAEIGFARDSLTLRIGYHAPRAMDQAAQVAIRNSLRRALAVDTLETSFDWRGPVPPPDRKKAQR